MRKKITLLVTVVALSLAMVACGTAQTSNNPTATPEPTKEVEATTAPTATNTPAAEPTAEPTVEPTATATPTPEPTATSVPEATATPEPTVTSAPEAIATPEPTATPKPTKEQTEGKAFPYTMSFMYDDTTQRSYRDTCYEEDQTSENLEWVYSQPREITKTFDTFAELTEYVYDKMNNEMVWDYSDAEVFMAALDSAYVEVKEVKVDVKGDEDLEEMFTTKHALNVVYDADRNEVAVVPVEYYKITLVERTTGESCVMGHKFVLEEVENPGTYHEETYSDLSYARYIVNGPEITPKPTATPVPTATPKPTEAPKPTKAPVVESKDFKTVLRELHSLDDYATREAYVNKLDKSAYKVSTIKAKDFYSEGNLDALFTGDIANSYELAGVYYGCSIDGKYELVTVVDTTTGEVDVWGVKYDASLSGETEHVRAVPELVLYAYNSIYGGEHGNILTWDSLKYYIDIFNPADYLE